MPPPGQPSYPEQLGAILRRRDPLALQAFLVQSARRFGDERQVAEVEEKNGNELLELMHRMIISRPDLKDLHRESREWLFKHGVDPSGPEGNRRN